MRNRILLALSAMFIVGSFSLTCAQKPTTATTRIKTASEVTPSWTYKGVWYGFVTCNRLQREGNMVTADQVNKCLAEGGTCILASGGGGNRMDLKPNEKCKQYAAQQVLLTGLMTSQRYGTGPTADAAVDGLASGGDRPAAKFQGLTIVSAEIVAKLPPTGRVDTSRMTEESQQ